MPGNFKGGRHEHAGHIRVLAHGHPRENVHGFVCEHILIAEKRLIASHAQIREVGNLMKGRVVRITAKFNGNCTKCGGRTRQGEEIEYIDKKAYHVACKPEEHGELSDAEQYALADKLGFSHFSWEHLLSLHGTAVDERERPDCPTPERPGLRDVPTSDTIESGDTISGHSEPS